MTATENSKMSPPSAIPAGKEAQLLRDVRKAGSAVENILLRLGIPDSEWYDVLRWIAQEIGAEIGHHWQVVWALALLERPLPVDEAVWLLENLGDTLAYRAKESVFHGASLLLGGWHFALDAIVMRSFAGHLDRLQEATINETYRLGVLYARGALGDELSEEEKSEVLAALALGYATQRAQLTVTLPGDDDEFVAETIDFNDDEDGAEELWKRLVAPFAEPEEWSRAILAAAAANEREASRWDRKDIVVERVLRHAEHGSPEELALTIAFGALLGDAERGELAETHLSELDAADKQRASEALRSAAEETEREVPKEVSKFFRPDGAALVAEIEALAAASGRALDTRIYVPVVGEESASGIGEIAPEIYGLEGVPEFNGEMMAPLVTLDLAEVPELAKRLGCEALAFFISARGENEASELDSGEVAVMRLSVEQARDLSEGTPFRLAPVDVPAAVFESDPPEELEELAAKIRALPARVLGAPTFVQGEARTEGFVMQLDESFVDANFGGGVMFLYEDDGFWQC